MAKHIDYREEARNKKLQKELLLKKMMEMGEQSDSILRDVSFGVYKDAIRKQDVNDFKNIFLELQSAMTRFWHNRVEIYEK